MSQYYLVLVAVLAASFCATVLGGCEVCHLRNDHTKDFATPENVKEFKNCKQWKDNACCSADTANRIDSLYPGYEWDRCDAAEGIPKKMSKKCKEFFVNEACFYECDVNAGKYRKHFKCGSTDDGNAWQMVGMPIKASYCDAWFKACKNDYICASKDSQSFFSLPDVDCVYKVNSKGKETGTCRKFKDVYANGKEVCENMWDQAFQYEEREELAFTMDFEGENPNNEVHTSVRFPDPCPEHDVAITEEGCEDAELHESSGIEVVGCEVCHLRNDHTLDVANPSVQSLGKCAKYDDNACCSPDTAAKIEDHTLYGPEYAWDRCYEGKARKQFPAKCHRWFVEEYCFYECDVNAGKYRKHKECDEADGGNAWQINKLPLKASECDQWYEDCKDALFCTCTSEEDCRFGGKPKSFFSLPSLECTEDQCKTFGEIYEDGKELCEAMWDGSFVYETHENAAYSMIWNPVEHDINPNNFVNTHIPFPENCPAHEADKDLCIDASNDDSGR